MSAQKIVLVNGSNLFRDMLKRVIKRADGLQTVAEVNNYGELENTISQSQPDWLILSVQPEATEIHQSINSALDNNPSLRLLVLGIDGSKVRMMWKHSENISLDNRNLEELLDILRNHGIQTGVVQGKDDNHEVTIN